MSMFNSPSLRSPRYNFVCLLKSIVDFSAKNNVSAGVFPSLLLFAAEDFYTSVYYSARHGRELRNYNLLANPGNMQATPVISKINKCVDPAQHNNCQFEFIFPLAHRNLDIVTNGYAKDVLSSYGNHVFDLKSIKSYDPREPKYFKESSSGNSVTLIMPIKDVVQSVLPSLEHHYLPLFIPKKNTCAFSCRKSF